MAQIKLANGTAVKELRVWDGLKWAAKTGRVWDGTKWADFMRPPLSFKDDFVTPVGLSRQLAQTFIKSAINIGTTILPVQTTTGFFVGQEVTIADGVNSENLRVIGNNLLPNSKVFLLGVPATGITTSITPEGYLKVVSVLPNNNYVGSPILFGGVEDKFVEGEIVTISMEVMSPDHIALPNLYVKPSMSYLSFNGQMSNQFSTISQTRKWSKTGGISVHLGFLGIGGTTIIKSVKIEKGSLATPWTPAPEDIGETNGTAASISPTTKTYKNNAVIGRTNSVAVGGKLTFGNVQTFGVEQRYKLLFNGVNNYVGFSNAVICPKYTWFSEITPSDVAKDQMFLTGVSRADYFRMTGGYLFGSASTLAGQKTLSGKTKFVNDQTYKVALTYDGISLKLYVNGATESSLLINSSAVPFQLGVIGYWTSTDIRAFQGVIKNVRIYNKALSEAQLKALQTTEVIDGLVNSYAFDEGVGTSITDRTGTSIGTINGATWT